MGAEENSVSYKECGVGMTDPSLYKHTDRTHGIVLTYNRGLNVGRGGPETYRVSFPQVLKLVEFLVDGFRERANNPGRLR